MISWSILSVCCFYCREILNIPVWIQYSALYCDRSTNPIDFKSRNEQRLFWGIRDKCTAVLLNGMRRLSLRVALDSIDAPAERSHLFPACRPSVWSYTEQYKPVRVESEGCCSEADAGSRKVTPAALDWSDWVPLVSFLPQFNVQQLYFSTFRSYILCWLIF